MTAREYLGQAYRLDQRISSKIEMLDSLNDLAAKATSTLTGLPHNPARAVPRWQMLFAKLSTCRTKSTMILMPWWISSAKSL